MKGKQESDIKEPRSRLSETLPKDTKEVEAYLEELKETKHLEDLHNEF